MASLLKWLDAEAWPLVSVLVVAEGDHAETLFARLQVAELLEHLGEIEDAYAVEIDRAREDREGQPAQSATHA